MSNPNLPDGVVPDVGSDPLDRELAEGFAHIHAPEDLVSILLNAAEATPTPRRTNPVAIARRAIPTVLLAAAAAAVAFLVLRDVPTGPIPEEAPAAPMVVPEGQRAVTVSVPTSLVSDDDLQRGALVDIVLLTSDTTTTFVHDAMVLAAAEGHITLACTPGDAERLVLSQEHGVLAPLFHAGEARRVTVPVDPASVRAGIVQVGARTDVLATQVVDGTLETLTVLTDVVIEHVHEDGRITVLADPKEAERLLHASERGRLSLSLRGN
jgi:hypothetical protein